MQKRYAIKRDQARPDKPRQERDKPRQSKTRQDKRRDETRQEKRQDKTGRKKTRRDDTRDKRQEAVVFVLVGHHFWTPWGLFGVAFGNLGGHFGRLGGSWALLGGSWGVFGESWKRLKPEKAPKKVRIKFLPALDSVWGTILAPQDDPKTTPRPPKIDQKIVLKNDRVLDRS